MYIISINQLTGYLIKYFSNIPAPKGHTYRKIGLQA